MLNKLKNSFLTGLIVILPAILTIIIFAFLITQINEKVLSPIVKFFNLDSYSPYWTYLAKLIAFLLSILFIALIGAATRLILLRKFFGFWEKILLRVPTIGKIYVTIKEMIRALLGQGKHVFEKVVLIEYPRKGIYSIGFLTAQGCEEIQQKTKKEVVYVFLPTTPNPTNGFFLIVPKDEIVPLDMSVADGLKLIISGGTFSPPT